MKDSRHLDRSNHHAAGPSPEIYEFTTARSLSHRNVGSDVPIMRLGVPV